MNHKMGQLISIAASGVIKVGSLLACCLLMIPCVFAQPPSQSQTLTPTYWKQRLFFIPYQANRQDQRFNQIAKVQLLSSRTGANDWSTLKEAEPNVQGFSYHAPEDGEYWFALRHLDRRGQPWPNNSVQPQMRIVVDTEVPKLAIDGSPSASGQVVIRYEARDVNLDSKSLQIEVLGAGGQWTPLQLPQPDIAQPDRLLGRVTWQAPIESGLVKLRASVIDKTGQRADSNTEVSLAPNALPGPTLRDPLSNPEPGNTKQPTNLYGSDKKVDPFTQVAKLPAQQWPANNRLPQSPVLDSGQAPPITNPYTTAGQARTPARLVGEGAANKREQLDALPRPQSLSVTPLGADNTPSQTDKASQPSSQSTWTPSRSENVIITRVVNSRIFDVEYDLQSVGPWGVAKVELWGTHDNGRTWQSFGVDPDNRSPIRVTVPNAGTFGFRILVDGANSVGAAAPRTGDEPELTVAVDLQPPTAELLSADLGQGNLSGHLLMHWTASDTNLEPRPIALFYSSYPNGPWSTIASGLENTGEYTWRIGRHVPGRFYLRLEARDEAGNLATFQTPEPIALSRPKPTGKLRSVRSVAN